MLEPSQLEELLRELSSRGKGSLEDLLLAKGILSKAQIRQARCLASLDDSPETLVKKAERQTGPSVPGPELLAKVPVPPAKESASLPSLPSASASEGVGPTVVVPSPQPRGSTRGKDASPISEVFRRSGDLWETADGRFRIDRELGRGGMGIVFKAWQKDLGRPVALKMLPTAQTLGEEDRARFLREARAAAGVSHPNIVAIHEFGEWGDVPFLVMEFVEGETLADRLRGRPLSATSAVEVILPIAEALAEAHRRNILHRDVKPGNIFLTKQGAPKLGDFGLARIRGEVSLTNAGDILGTPRYMSPEQARGTRRLVGAASDVYSLGTTLYECLCGVPPFIGSVQQVISKVIGEEPLPVRRRNRGVPADLETIVMTCLEKDPHRRYRTAGELAQDLRRFLAGEPIAARPVGYFTRLGRKAVRRRVAIAVAAGFSTVAILATLGVLVPRWREAERQKELAESQTRDAERQRVSAEADTLRAEKRQKDLQELGTLWIGVVMAKQAIQKAAVDPKTVRQDLQHSIGKLTRFIRDHPDNPQAHYVRARGRLYLNQLKQAEEDLRAALRLDPEFAPAWNLLGFVKLKEYHWALYVGTEDIALRGKLHRALLEEARTALDRGGLAREGRVSVEKWGLPVSEEEDRITDVITRALWLCFLQDKREEADRLLQKEHAEHPAGEYCNIRSGWQQDFRKMHELAQEAVGRMPNLAQAHLDLGNVHMSFGHFEKALQDFTRAIERDPALVFAYHSRANTKMRFDDYKGAREDWSAAYGIDESQGWVLAHRALARIALGDLPGAVEDSTRAIETHPHYAMGYLNRARARLGLGIVLDALEDCRRAVQVDPKFVEAFRFQDVIEKFETLPADPGGYIRRAGIRLDLLDLAGAREDCDRAIQLDGNLKDAHQRRATVRHRQGDYAGAVQDLTKTLELLPDHAEGYADRAWARCFLGQFQAAQEDANQAVRLKGSLPMAYIARGLALEGLGRKQEADRDYAEATRLSPQARSFIALEHTKIFSLRPPAELHPAGSH